MEEKKERSRPDDIEKRKIRERYKGVSEDVLDVIPAMPQEDFYKSEVHKRVAVYARVSTDDINQTSSYELQKNHYEDLVNRHPNWELVDIYADEGISGTSLQHRDSFIRMIGDCNAGKIDLIITKSVSRFARNIIDCIGYVRQLKAADPPIGVYFETENIFTLDENSEMSLSFIATLAQEESHTKSEIMNSSIEMRFKRGIFLTPVLLGYDHDENGNLIVNEEEAKTVRLIFFSYLYGYSAQKIADALTQLERYTKKGNQTWSAGSVIQILQNERYCGDILSRKTYTPNYLDHKSKKNNHDRNQYRQKNHHEAIVSREDFFAVQKMIRNAKYGNKGYFPEMLVVLSGLLKGFVTIHPKWAGFREEDYYLASGSINEGITVIPANPLEVSLKKGSLDLSGYEIVRPQFMSISGRPAVTLSSSAVTFTRSCLYKCQADFIELLFHPRKKVLAVRGADSSSRYSVKWSTTIGSERFPRPVSGSAFLPTLFRLLGWKADRQYKVIGYSHTKNGETILCFDLSDAVMRLSEDDLDISSEEASPDTDAADQITQKKKKRIDAYPSDWSGSFGEKYYKSLAIEYEEEKQTLDDKGSKRKVFKTDDSEVTSTEKAARNIDSILKDIGAYND